MGEHQQSTYRSEDTAGAVVQALGYQSGRIVGFHLRRGEGTRPNTAEDSGVRLALKRWQYHHWERQAMTVQKWLVVKSAEEREGAANERNFTDGKYNICVAFSGGIQLLKPLSFCGG
ncbi:hypothetical protein UY3_09834 [Chelonia mydas]|uniref:Uncharacterized protein n=1 Tax=Chelonia mydas TaxID=8469 RepID=M7B514_CHEMY|nr:hypothetical protein UY3_09834 [Chelonia mydas]